MKVLTDIKREPPVYSI